MSYHAAYSLRPSLASSVVASLTRAVVRGGNPTGVCSRAPLISMPPVAYRLPTAAGRLSPSRYRHILVVSVSFPDAPLGPVVDEGWATCGVVGLWRSSAGVGGASYCADSAYGGFRVRNGVRPLESSAIRWPPVWAVWACADTDLQEP
ncbi:hypothetical protein GUJ93_ZPchr0001g32835 [Zizania palustris]|uniref:Uncharacterized protein n=1 Tax=Zizania palustris TaxID=103762 RepID=A0A8J5S939_ZIZPA|nr:hypothetical protein GUJ93_ZPchr0001g32835 [Zizania palustris]